MDESGNLEKFNCHDIEGMINSKNILHAILHEQRKSKKLKIKN